MKGPRLTPKARRLVGDFDKVVLTPYAAELVAAADASERVSKNALHRASSVAGRRAGISRDPDAHLGLVAMRGALNRWMEQHAEP